MEGALCGHLLSQGTQDDRQHRPWDTSNVTSSWRHCRSAHDGGIGPNLNSADCGTVLLTLRVGGQSRRMGEVYVLGCQCPELAGLGRRPGASSDSDSAGPTRLSLRWVRVSVSGECPAGLCHGQAAGCQLEGPRARPAPRPGIAPEAAPRPPEAGRSLELAGAGAAPGGPGAPAPRRGLRRSGWAAATRWPLALALAAAAAADTAGRHPSRPAAPAPA